MSALLRTTALILFLVRFFYWFYTEIQSHQAIRKSEYFTSRAILKRIIATLGELFLIFQLSGWEILPYPEVIPLEIIGLLFVIIGTAIIFIARKHIGTNWTHAAEFQVKKGQQLVTTGIYKYIRHPIYASLIVTIIGIQLVVGTWLVIPATALVIYLGYTQAKREEYLLLQHFGTKYQDYMKTSWMLVPRVI